MKAEGEVTILCLVNEVRIPDLGLFLTRGQSVKIAFSKAMSSRDLSRARVDGMVQTQVLRTQSIRQPSSLDEARVKELVSSNVTTSVTPRHNSLPPPPVVDFSPVLLALSSLIEEVRSLRRDMAENRAATPPSPVVDLTPLVQALQGLKSVSVSSPLMSSLSQTENDSPPSEEMFIPGRIVTDVAPVNLEVVSRESDGGEVNDVAAALKKARKAR